MSLARTLVVASFALAACTGDDPSPSSDTSTTDAGAEDDSSSPVQDAGGQDAASCSATTCGSACVDLTTSAENCGACGHSCGNGTCAASVCKPVLVQNNINGPVAVAVSAQSVFWLRDGAVERCASTGCTSPTLISDAPKVLASNPTGTILVTDGAFVAWLSSPAAGGALNVFACGVAGCNNGQSPKAATGLNDTPTQLAVSGSNVYVTQTTGSARGGPIGTLVLTGITGTANDVPTGVAADDTNVYIAGAITGVDRGVGKCAIAGASALSPLFSTPDGQRIALAGTTLVATSTAGIVTCTNAAQATGCGGASATIAPDVDAIAVAGDATNAVWAVPGSTTQSTGTIRACAMPDCKGGPRTIADAQAQPVSVTVSGGFVYWANKGVDGVTGSVWRAAL